MVRNIWGTIVEVFDAWLEDKAPRMGAAIAYYAVFSMAPLLVLALAVGGLIFTREAARNSLMSEIQSTLGGPAASALESIAENVQKSGHGAAATVFGIVTLLIGATGVFTELQDALNTIWRVRTKEGRSVWQIVRERFLSFTVVIGTAFLLLISLVVSALLTALGNWLSSSLAGGEFFWRGFNMVLSFLSVTLLFTIIFKMLPDVRLPWRPVFVGALTTALLFMLGKYAIGVYLAQSGATTAFGAAASLVVLLLWVYYSAQILLLGAVFTRVLVGRSQKRVEVTPNAQPQTANERVKQGLTT